MNFGKLAKSLTKLIFFDDERYIFQHFYGPKFGENFYIIKYVNFCKDELVSVDLETVKDQKCIIVKSSNRELIFSFEWKFETDQWYHDILKVWKNVNRLSKNAPKQLSIRRSMKDEAKRQEKMVLAKMKISEGISSLELGIKL